VNHYLNKPGYNDEAYSVDKPLLNKRHYSYAAYSVVNHYLNKPHYNDEVYSVKKPLLNLKPYLAGIEWGEGSI